MESREEKQPALGHTEANARTGAAARVSSRWAQRCFLLYLWTGGWKEQLGLQNLPPQAQAITLECDVNKLLSMTDFSPVPSKDPFD